MALLNSRRERQFWFRKSRIIPLAIACLTVVLCLIFLARDDANLSDAEKREIVYRMYANYKKDFPAVEDMPLKEAMELQNRQAVVFVDTRKPAEKAISILPGAIGKEDFISNPDQFKGKTVVAYCTISYRSGLFAQEMAKKGIPVKNLKAGMLAWILGGGKIIDPSGKEVKRVHVYGDRWNYPPAGYESVKFSAWEQMR